MPDLAQPNYQTVDAQGRVGAQFSGHVQAAGLDLPAGVSSTPPADRRVRWLRQGDGTVATDITGYDDGSTTGMDHTVYPPSSGETGAWTASAQRPGPGSRYSVAGLRAMSYFAGVTPRNVVDAHAWSDDLSRYFETRIIAGDGSSSFLRLPTVQNVQLRFGSAVISFPVGETDILVPLPTAWPTNHLLFLSNAWLEPNGPAWSGFVIRGSQATDLSNGSVHVYANAAGTATIRFLSLGN